LEELRAQLSDAPRLHFPPGHFHSPIPDTAQLANRNAKIFDLDPTQVPGVALRLDEQWKLWDVIRPLVQKFNFPENEMREFRFFCKNDVYERSDAVGLFSMLLHLRPRRYLEIGSGFTSALVLDTQDRFLDYDLDITLVEPYVERLKSLLRDGDLARLRLLQIPAQELRLEEVDKLEAGDVLLIDSTHVLKTDSDVNYELFHILPRLQPGVVVHLHDIPAGFEYPRKWVMEGWGWNEAYAVRAFLQFNDAFEILLWPSLLWTIDPNRIEVDWPFASRNSGATLWIVRR
jgi:hypothetical protein